MVFLKQQFSFEKKVINNHRTVFPAVKPAGKLTRSPPHLWLLVSSKFSYITFTGRIRTEKNIFSPQ